MDLEKTHNMDQINLLKLSKWNYSTLCFPIVENKRKLEDRIKDLILWDSNKYNYLKEKQILFKWVNKNNKLYQANSQ